MLRRYPTTRRLIVTLFGVVATIALTFTLSGATNFNLALASTYAIVILGLSFLTGHSGQISLGNSAFMAVGGYVTAVTLEYHPHTRLIPILMFSVVASALAGLVMGLPATRLRGPYLAGMTLAFAVAIPQIPQSLGTWAGGSAGVSLSVQPIAPAWFHRLVSGPNVLPIAVQNQWQAILAISIAGVAFFLMANLFASKTGRSMRLVRDNDVAAELAGLNLPRTRTLAFVISAAFSGLGGSLYVLLTGTAAPNSQAFSFTFSITLLTLMVLGGIGTLQGAIYGGLLGVYSTNITNWISNRVGVNPYSNFGLNFQNILFGALLIVTMLVAPAGLAGIPRVLRGLMKKIHKR